MNLYYLRFYFKTDSVSLGFIFGFYVINNSLYIDSFLGYRYYTYTKIYAFSW